MIFMVGAGYDFVKGGGHLVMRVERKFAKNTRGRLDYSFVFFGLWDELIKAQF
jgi:hypothetical protein